MDPVFLTWMFELDAAELAGPKIPFAPALVKTIELPVAAPMFGVTRVGEFFKTIAPVPSGVVAVSSVKVPEEVIGFVPVSVKIDGTDNPTEVTVPAVAGAVQIGAPLEIVSISPFAPAPEMEVIFLVPSAIKSLEAIRFVAVRDVEVATPRVGVISVGLVIVGFV